MNIPKAFVSYSHDTLPHKKWVLDFATRLRTSGVDTILDQWELTPGDDLPHFMESQLSRADYIIMICTNRYVEKANAGNGGVGYEKMIITSNLISRIDENKIIPIIRQNGSYEVPTFLKTKLFVDFSKDDEYEFSFDEIIRKLHKTPIFEKPELGTNPFKAIDQKEAQPENDPIRDLLYVVVYQYERGHTISYDELHRTMRISRVMLDVLISKAEAKNYITLSQFGDIILSKEGKHYAIKNKLIK